MKHKTLAQYVICMSAFISTLSAGMFNIALVDIAEEFEQPIQSAQWVITAYLLVISICLPFMGRLGDIMGRRNVHNVGIMMFMLGSLCCALSTDLTSLIAFRVLQGIGTSMYQATNMALIISLFPADRRGGALGIASTFVAAGSMVGPSLGGFVLQWFTWQMNFWLLAFVALAAWVLSQSLIPKDEAERNVRLDWTGAALFSASLTGLITGLNLGSSWGWESAPVILLFFIFATGAVGLYLWSTSPRWEASGQAPFIQLGMFGDPRVHLGIATTIITTMAVFSAQLVLPMYLRTVLHLQPAIVGLILLAYPATLLFVAPYCGKLSDRLGSLPIIYTGLTFMVAALTALSLLPRNSSVLYVIIFTLILGCSMGMVNSPNNNQMMSSVPKHLLGLTGSMIALSRNMGMIFGTVAGGALMSLPSEGLPAAMLFTEEQVVSGFRAIFSLTAVLVAAIFVVQLVSARWNKRRASLQ